MSAKYRPAKDPCLKRNYSLANGEANKVSLRVKVKLLHEIGAMRFNGSRADEEPSGDFSGAQSFGGELQDNSFANCEPNFAVHARATAFLFKLSENQIFESRAQVMPSGGDLSHR